MTPAGLVRLNLWREDTFLGLPFSLYIDQGLTPAADAQHTSDKWTNTALSNPQSAIPQDSQIGAAGARSQYGRNLQGLAVQADSRGADYAQGMERERGQNTNILDSSRELLGRQVKI